MDMITLIILSSLFLIMVALLVVMLIFIKTFKTNEKIADMKEHIKELEKEEQQIENELEWHEKEVVFLETQRDAYIEQSHILFKREQELLSKLNKKQLLSFEPIFNDVKALIGDYLEESGENTRKILAQLGIEADIVRDGVQVLERLRSNDYHYDIIFTNSIYRNGIDDDGSILDGRKLVMKIKDELDNKLPVILVTVSNTSNEDANHDGFDGVLHKLISLEETKKLLLNILKNKTKRRL